MPGGRFLGALTAAALLTTTAALPSSAAPNPKLPVVTSRADGWMHPAQRPGLIAFGNGGAPYFTHLTWKSWTASSAYAQGTLRTMSATCAPAVSCPYHWRWASVWLHNPVNHGGRLYFGQMTVRYHRNGKLHRQHLHVGAGGYWIGPSRWPWF